MAPKTKTTTEFINEAILIHGNKYGYHNVVYKRSTIKVEIVCPQHGSFFQIPNAHLTLKQGCPKCRKQCTTKTANQFILDCKNIHGTKYDYSQTIYTGIHDKVTIICKLHGEFQQCPSSHLSGVGCKLCAYDKLPGKYTEKFFLFKPQMKSVPAKFYILQFQNSKEKFYKIGITQMSIQKRYRGKFPYSLEIIKELNLPLYEAFHLEQSKIKKFKKFKYEPQKKFTGHSECFSIVPL
jgi:hypothetical protein